MEMRLSALLAASILAGTCLVYGNVVSAQGYVSDVGIEKDDVTLGKQEYSPYLNQAFPNRVLWGDTHLHTSYSTDE